MNPEKAKPLSQSSTFRWLVNLAVVFAVQRWGIPALPAEVVGEFSSLIGIAVDMAFVACLGMIARGRMKATAVIKGVL